MRLPTGVLLGVGALASIATTVLGWSEAGEAPIAPVTLEHRNAAATYIVHVTADGGTFKDLQFEATINFTITPRAKLPFGTFVGTEVVGDDQVTHRDYDLSNVAGPSAVDGVSDSISLPGTCSAPCAKDFTITISRDPLIDLPAIDVTGTATGAISAIEKEPEGTSVTVTVEGPL